MREFMSKGFTAHPLLSHILNMQLRDNVVPQEMHEELKAKVKDLETMLEVVKRTADHAANAQKK